MRSEYLPGNWRICDEKGVVEKIPARIEEKLISISFLVFADHV